MNHSKVILTALLFGQCVLADAQSPLQDAIKLKSMLADLPALRQTRSEAELQFKDIERQVKNDKESLRRIESNGQKPTAAQRLEWGLHVQLFDSLQVLAQRAVLADTVAKNAVARIVQLYLEERGEETLKRAEIAGLIEEHNPFLKGVGITVENISTGLDGSITASLRTATSSLSTLDVTNLATGLADFLVERAKTELNTAFFQRFQETLEKEEFKDLRILFPETARLLKVIGNEIFRYDAYINNLRTAFNNDLGDLLRHAPDVVERHEKSLKKVNGLFPTLMIALDAAAQLDGGAHPGVMIDSLSTHSGLKELKTEFPELGNGMHLASMISTSLRSGTDTVRYWATKEEIAKLKDDKVLTIYLGLLLEWSKSEKYKDIKFTNKGTPPFCTGQSVPDGASLSEVLTRIGRCWDPVSLEVRQLKAYINAMAAEVQGLEDDLKALRELPKKLEEQKDLDKTQRRRAQFEAISAVVSSTLDVVEQAYDVEDFPYVSMKVPEKARAVVDVTRSALRMAAAVDQKQYGSAITELASILRYAVDSMDLNGESDTTLNGSTLQRLMRYGSFMAALAESESPEQAKAAIEAAALPPGSYSIKRNSGFSVSLNGYIGPFFGTESIKNAENNDWNNFGLTAPVGIAANWGNIPRSWKHKASIGLFASLIDVGAIASYRDKDSIAGAVPKITLGSIVAPGLFAEIGIPATPLTLGGGWQMGPMLREITNDSTSVVLGDAYERWVVTLKVDIPLVHFGASTGRNARSMSASKRERLNRNLKDAATPLWGVASIKDRMVVEKDPKKKRDLEKELSRAQKAKAKPCKAKCIKRRLNRR